MRLARRLGNLPAWVRLVACEPSTVTPLTDDQIGMELSEPVESALDGAVEVVPWDVQFDHARAVKSDAELESVRDSVRINTQGFHVFREAWAPGRTPTATERATSW